MPEDAFAWRQRQYEVRAQNRANLRAAATPAAPEVAPAPATRSFGFQSGAARPGGMGEQRLAEATAAGQTLGAPTSFAGGAGAPESIGVIRGMKQTYAQDTGGPQLQEFATPQQAGQAWNRQQQNQDLALARKTPGVTPNVAALTEKYGEYVPPQGPEIAARGEEQRKIQAAENRLPENVAKAEAIRAGEVERVAGTHVSALKNYLATSHPNYDKNEVTALDAKASEEVARQASRAGNPDATKKAIGHFQERQAVRAYLATDAGRQFVPPKLVNQFIAETSQNPEHWADLVKRGRALRVTAPASKPWYEQAAPFNP